MDRAPTVYRLPFPCRPNPANGSCLHTGTGPVQHRRVSLRQERFHFVPQFFIALSQSAQTLGFNMVASGSISDGRSFRFDYVFRQAGAVAIQIKFE
jgi:hypothetical protein